MLIRIFRKISIFDHFRRLWNCRSVRKVNRFQKNFLFCVQEGLAKKMAPSTPTNTSLAGHPNIYCHVFYIIKMYSWRVGVVFFVNCTVDSSSAIWHHCMHVFRYQFLYPGIDQGNRNQAPVDERISLSLCTCFRCTVRLGCVQFYGCVRASLFLS